ncbi:MAG: VCBS repeat-containing protein [Planctomycetota bacterium]
MRLTHPTVLTAIVTGACTAAAAAQPDESLAAYFGFDQPHTLVIDDDCGPVVHADFNADGRPDIAVVNNRKSRIELYHLRATPRTDAELERDLRVNDFRPNRFHDRTDISVRHRIGALLVLDANNDQRPDLLYAGRGDEVLVLLEQRETDRFQSASTVRLPGLLATPPALATFAAAGQPAIACIAEQRLHIVPMTLSGQLRAPIPIGAAAELRAVYAADFNADDRQDLVAIAPAELDPVRLWLQRPRQPGAQSSASASDWRGAFPAELRFDMPELAEAEPVRTPGRDADSLAVIERATRRIVLYDLNTEPVVAPDASATSGLEADVQAEIVAFPGDADNRPVITADLNGDNTPDLITTNPGANSLAVAFNTPAGLAPAREFPTLKEPAAIDAGHWPTDASSGGADTPALFVLSQAEKTIGVSRLTADQRLSFPNPIAIATPGATPLTLRHVTLAENEPALAVIVRKRRDLFVELHRPNGAEALAIELRGVTKPPTAILAADADRDGDTDLLLLTPGEPLIMLPAEPSDTGDPAFATVLQADDMPQFGLVSAAGPDNTLFFNIDDEPTPELLFAADNVLRAATYDTPTESNPGGWRVVEQFNTEDPTASLVSIARRPGVSPPTFVAADAEHERLLTFTRTGNAWTQQDPALHLRGFELSSIIAGPFAPNAQPAVLALADDGYAFVRLAGARQTLEEVAVYRSDADDRVEHEIETGDVNSDGYTDLVILDAGEQMCQILTLSKTRRILEATEFKVFESRLFSGGDAREFEPSYAIVADLTGDNRDDILLLVHDRLIIYPQQTAD